MENLISESVTLNKEFKELNINRYFDNKKTLLCYDITYKFQEYKPNKFYLEIDIFVFEERYYSYFSNYKKYYYFDSILHISNRYNIEKNTCTLSIIFVGPNNDSVLYEYDKFNKEDSKKVYNFIVKNMFGKYD